MTPSRQSQAKISLQHGTCVVTVVANVPELAAHVAPVKALTVLAHRFFGQVLHHCMLGVSALMDGASTGSYLNLQGWPPTTSS